MDKDKTINIFIAYSRDDENFLKQLEDHFSVISRDKSIQFWWDGMMSPGQEWDETIKEKLNQADIILLLVSSSFFASDYINTVELPKALHKHEQGIARVIPIILRTCAWQLIEDIGKLQALPQDGKAVSTWPNADEAYTNIIMAVQKTVETIRAKLSVPGEQEVKEEEVIVPEENPVIETGWSSPLNISQPSDSNAFPQKDLASEGWKEDKTIAKKPVEKTTEPVDQEHSNREEKTLEKEVSTNTLELKLSLEQMAKHYGYPMKEMGPNKFSIDLHFPVDSKTLRYQLVYVWISDIGRDGKPCIYMSSRVGVYTPAADLYNMFKDVAAGTYCMVTISKDTDLEGNPCETIIVQASPNLESTNYDLFHDILLEVAVVADFLEEKYFKTDKN